MKKNILEICNLTLLLFVFLGINACVREKVIYVDSDGNVIEHPELAPDEGILNISVSNTSVESRAARPVGSSAADNNVNIVKIYAFSKQISDGTDDGIVDGSSNTTEYKFDVSVGAKSESINEVEVSGSNGIIILKNFVSSKGEHQPGTDVDFEDHTDQTCSITLKGLKDGYVYKFVAVGYNGSIGNDALPENPYGEFALSEFKVTENNADGSESEFYNVGVFEKKFTTSVSKTYFGVEELFAGESVEVYPATLGTNKLILTRQVAGMLGYFKNIPTMVGGSVVKYLRVYASQNYEYFYYPAQSSDLNGATVSMNGSENQGNSESSDAAVSDVENNSSTDTRQLLLEFDMSKIATNYQESGQTSTKYTFYSGTDGSGYTASGSGQTSETQVSNGEIPPLANDYTAPDGLKLAPNSIFGGRFVIPYGTEDGDGINTITVELQDNEEKCLKKYNVFSKEEYSQGSGVAGQYIKNYNIKCNNFYSLGVKESTEENDSDEPIDLATGADIIVSINDAWEVLHQMGVEEGETE